MKKLNTGIILNYVILLLGLWGCFVGVSRFNMLPLFLFLISGILAIFRNKSIQKLPQTIYSTGSISMSAVADIVAFGLVPVYIAYNHVPRYSIFVSGVIYVVVVGTRQFFLDTAEKPYRKPPIQTVAFLMPVLHIVRVHFSDIAEKSDEMFVLNSIFLVAMAILTVIKLPQKK